MNFTDYWTGIAMEFEGERIAFADCHSESIDLYTTANHRGLVAVVNYKHSHLIECRAYPLGSVAALRQWLAALAVGDRGKLEAAIDHWIEEAAGPSGASSRRGREPRNGATCERS